MDALADRLETANGALKGDWVRWQNNMKDDLKSAFISTAEKNVECYEKVRVKCPCAVVEWGDDAFLQSGWRAHPSRFGLQCLAVWESFLLSQRRDPVERQDEDAG